MRLHYSSLAVSLGLLGLLSQVHAFRKGLVETSSGREGMATEHVHLELDRHTSYHARRYLHGPAALEWLANDTQVLPQPAHPVGGWPENLVVGYAGGYDFEILKPLIYSFLAHVEEPSWLVLLTPSDSIPGLPGNLSRRIVVQPHAMPDHLQEDNLPYPVSLRFYVTVALLRSSRHSGHVFFCDTRDVFIQRDPFADHSDGVLHFPRESAAYRLKGPFTDNSVWLLKCYGKETMAAIGGNYVLNSGTLLGPTQLLVRYFGVMLREFEHRWHCMRLHGSDQAVHNYLVYTGKLIGSGIEFQVEDQIAGRFAFVAYAHPGVWDFRYVNEQREELYNREGQAMVAIHLWPGDNRVADKVVWPFVAEFERGLAGSPSEAAVSPSGLPEDNTAAL